MLKGSVGGRDGGDLSLRDTPVDAKRRGRYRGEVRMRSAGWRRIGSVGVGIRRSLGGPAR